MLRHQYVALGNRTHTTLQYGRTVTIQRYGSGHWHGTLWQGAAIIDLERDVLHRETGRSLGRGRTRLQQSRAYDPQSRLTAISLSV